MPHSLVIVRVLEVEPYVANLRARFDPAALRGLGAHVTLLHAALPRGGIDPAMKIGVAAIAAASAPFAFEVTRVARFPATVYLAVEPAVPFENLHQRLTALAPARSAGHRPRRDFVPHISVVRQGSGADPADRAVREAEGELGEALARRGPVRCVCLEIVLLEDSTGTWRPVQSFALSGCGAQRL